MAKKQKRASKPAPAPGRQATISNARNAEAKKYFLPAILAVIGITAACFYSMLDNGFTNWDDEIYVINNALIKGPDWKGIFTQAVSANYHPLTMVSFVLNYNLSELEPFSYHLFNYLFHLVNTGLVFYFIWIISDKKTWVAVFAAIVFGIHPMHVESVAWISERKDVLYTFFFLLSLIAYWKYLQFGKPKWLLVCFAWFFLSLLSKPAAVILPLVLLLLDYWKGISITPKSILQKLPFFILSVVFGIITIKMQSQSAIAGLDAYPWWTRIFFACYVVMIYFFRFFIPYPLSAFHPYPPANDLPVAVFASPIFIIGLIALLWYLRKNRLVVFSLLFFVVNLLLVLQIITIGLTIISERYTYVPYIGLSFLIAMLLAQYSERSSKSVQWIVTAVVVVVFGTITFQRTDVWKDSDSLWSNVIEHYPNSTVPRTNRANYKIKLAVNSKDITERNTLFQEALEDCNEALKVKPNHPQGYEDRQFIYYTLHENEKALADAETLIKLDPRNKLGYYTRGLIFMRLNEPGRALADFDSCLSIMPNYDAALNNRGTVLVNSFQKYEQALVDFNKAISINPDGNYYLNRAVCLYKMGEVKKAKEDVIMAMQKGMNIPDNFRQVLNL